MASRRAAIGYLRLIGISQSRTSSVVALRLTASWTGDSWPRRSIAGTIPEVETVTRRAERSRPSWSIRVLVAGITASGLCSGSPIPMKTTFERGGVRDSGSPSIVRLAWITWPMISAVLRSPRRPIFPVKQKAQRIAQPIWLEMQRVERSLPGITTDSTIAPSSVLKSSFFVPSAASRISSRASASIRPAAARRRRISPRTPGIELMSAWAWR